MEGFEYFKKLGIEKANLEEFRGEGVELIYSTYICLQIWPQTFKPKKESTRHITRFIYSIKSSDVKIVFR